MAFSPVLASKRITQQYKRYLSTIFQIADAEYQSQFTRELQKPSMYAAGPFLEVRSNFKTDKTLRQMISSCRLPRAFERLGFAMDRPLYAHQAQALGRIAAGRNLVVSTGTGSGKTESFLIPILAELVREYEAGTLGSGVRALLIYPMNALANDQVERLRVLLECFPAITFGAYTGQTKEKTADALAEYKHLHRGQTPIQSERISREQMKESPPHLLITNYAMLEYLMVRPKDSIFFDSDTWRFIVLDEAHIYRGSTGIEVSMLLRRLRASLPGCQLQYILTSATLGGEDENEDVAMFAQNLCASPFSAQDVIRASRIAPAHSEEPIALPAAFYQDTASMLDKGMSDQEIDGELLRAYPRYHLDPTAPLFDAVRRDGLYWRIRSEVGEPRCIAELSGALGMKTDELERFVQVAAHCESGGVRLFDARYHMFLRATESVFITLAPSKKLFLERRRQYTEANGQTFAVFEMCVCGACHAIYLIGREDESHRLVQCSGEERDAVFCLTDEASDTDEDELGQENKTTPYTLCAICGYLKKRKVRSARGCGHDSRFQVPVVRINAASRQDVKKCIVCERVKNNGILRTFFTGQEAVTSVIATSLFQELPQTEVRTQTTATQDDFGFGFGEGQTAQVEIERAKQFLCFSDSRQASAYFATYMDTTYRQLLYKRAIVRCLSTVEDDQPLGDFCEDLGALFRQSGVLKGMNLREDKESWKAILAEAADTGKATSLSGMGIMALGLRERDVKANPKLNLTQADVAAVLNVMVQSMIADLAIYCPVPMTQEDMQFYTYGTTACRYRLSSSDAQRRIRSFVPSRENMSNRRLDYLMRVMAQKMPDFDPARMRGLLEAFYKLLQGMQMFHHDEDTVQLDACALHVLRPQRWYRCTKCRRLTPFHAAGVCPTYRCDGRLELTDAQRDMQDNHYYRLVHDMELRALRIREHTAQLDRSTAYEYQQAFKEKRLDVLSCSTTFEMGVDVGSLETVFMRNMPPLPANYAQRAGRAGRSKKSAAYALTFCNRSSHDFSYFRKPTDMIAGQIHAPHFNVINEKIAVRHLYASALAFFFRANPQYFSTVKTLAGERLDAGVEDDGTACFERFLRARPQELRRFLEAFLPRELYDGLRCADFGWVDGLVGRGDGHQGKLTMAVEEYRYEVGMLNKAADEAFKRRGRTDYFLSRIRNYEREDVLSFLSRHNVMPQYGFPVDTVSMQVEERRNGAHYGVELQRDLAMAISEYAPDSQVVANGRLFTGRYIRKMPGINWKMYDYITCSECGTLNLAVNVGSGANAELERCVVCECALTSEKKKTFLIPAFGFAADPEAVCKPELVRPQRTYQGDISYVGYRNPAIKERISLGCAQAEIQYSSRDEMAVLNTSDFYVCETCGYAQTGGGYMMTLEKKHRMLSGRECPNSRLHRLSLGYRFETDVFQLRFLEPMLEADQIEQARSVLYGLIRGICEALDIEERDIGACLQWFSEAGQHGYGFVFYDTTPGGAGHVRRMENPQKLLEALQRTQKIVTECTCGAEEGDTSCYGCLRTYSNQKWHDLLKRQHVIAFLKKVLGQTAHTHPYSG